MQAPEDKGARSEMGAPHRDESENIERIRAGLGLTLARVTNLFTQLDSWARRSGDRFLLQRCERPVRFGLPNSRRHC